MTSGVVVVVVVVGGPAAPRPHLQRRCCRCLLHLVAAIMILLLILFHPVESFPDPCRSKSADDNSMMGGGSSGQPNGMMMLMSMGEMYGMCGNYTTCSAEGNLTCATMSNRTCLRDLDDPTSTANGTCGNCLMGHVDVTNWNGTTDGGGCMNVQDITWEMYESTFMPVYGVAIEYNESTSVEEARLQRLHAVLQYVSEARAQVPPLPYALQPNQFSADLPPDQRGLAGHNTILNATEQVGFERFNHSTNSSRRRQLQSSSTSLPSAVDWVDAGAVTYVKNQGRCGCCWSISCMGAVEGATYITNTYIDSLSFQQLVSCDTQNEGCQGGNIAYALQYAVTNNYGGLTLYNDYPFVDSDGTTTTSCGMAGKPLDVAVFEPVVVVSYGDTSSLSDRIQTFKQAVASQPVSITMNANCDTFNSYAGGILTDDGDCACQDVSCIDHAILIVGYNDTYNPPYWIIKNSWGTSWGDQGYFLVAQQGGGNWGLFGILGEGVVPLKADNTTGQVAEPPTSNGITLGYDNSWHDAISWWSSWGLGAATIALGWIV